MEIAHDPRTKQQLKDAIHSFLYEPVRRSFDKKLRVIIRKNSQILQSPHESFTYKGKIYAVDPKVPLHAK